MLRLCTIFFENSTTNYEDGRGSRIASYTDKHRPVNLDFSYRLRGFIPARRDERLLIRCAHPGPEFLGWGPLRRGGQANPFAAHICPAERDRDPRARLTAMNRGRLIHAQREAPSPFHGCD